MRGGLTDSCSRLSTFGLQGALSRGGPYPHRSTPPAPGFYVPFHDLGGGIASSEYLTGVGAQPIHTRTTAAWTRLANGLWTSVAAGNLRSYYNEDGVYCGALFEPLSTNRCLWNRDLTNAVWVTTGSPTVAKDGTGMDGVANSCSTITCGAAGDTVGQTVVLASNPDQGAFWLKRLVGSGTVEISIDGGTNWTDVTSQLSTSHFRFCAPPVTTVTNPNLMLRMGTPGDKVAVDMALIQTSYNVSHNTIDTPIETTTVSVTRNTDFLGNYAAANISNTQGTIFAELSTLYATSGNVRVVVHLANAGSVGGLIVPANQPAAMIGINDGSISNNSYNADYSMLNAPQECASSWGVSSGMKYVCYKSSLKSVSGSNSYSAFDGSMGVNAGVFVSRGSAPMRGCIKELRIWDHQLDINILTAIVNRGGR